MQFENTVWIKRPAKEVFEFISLEHTAKNVMITAVKGNPRAAAGTEINNLMEEFGLKKHYLGEKLAGA